MEVLELDLTDPVVVRDPHAAYGAIRERSPLFRVVAPGMDPFWAVTRYHDARALLSDPRFQIPAQRVELPVDLADECHPYLATMSERNPVEHARLRRLVAPTFTARRAAEFRPRVAQIVLRLLDELPGHASDGEVDLLTQYAWRLPIETICELVGIPEADRPRWRNYGAIVAAVGSSGSAGALAAAVPDFLADAKRAVAAAREVGGDDLLGVLLRARTMDGDRLTEVDLVTLVWHLVLAGQTPGNLIANAVAELFAHPEQLALVRAGNTTMPRAVEELTRWCGPAMLAIPRLASEDVELHGISVRKDEAVSAAIVAANRDPRVYTDPERLDVTRDARMSPHIGFGHGPHFCLGAALARVETEVALTMLFDRYVDLKPVTPPQWLADAGTRRLVALPVVLRP